jgi:hypothetical protein
MTGGEFAAGLWRLLGVTVALVTLAALTAGLLEATGHGGFRRQFGTILGVIAAALMIGAVAVGWASVAPRRTAVRTGTPPTPVPDAAGRGGQALGCFALGAAFFAAALAVQ